jgi:hypothetical protein
MSELQNMTTKTLPNDMNELASMWLAAKKQEENATEDRRDIEDHIKKLATIAENLEGTETVEPGQYVIKIVGRIDRKVDGDKVQELAAEHGLTDHLAKLFRWKPELNMSAWKAADETITKPLAGAITAKPGRPSFKIIPKE